jgi:hypothetical protein
MLTKSIRGGLHSGKHGSGWRTCPLAVANGVISLLPTTEV